MLNHGQNVQNYHVNWWKRFSFRGTSSPRPPTGAPPLNPAGGLPSPRPPNLCPPNHHILATPMAGTTVSIYTAWWTEAHACKQLAQGRLWSGATRTRTCDLLTWAKPCNNGKFDPCKYKTVKNVEKPAGIYRSLRQKVLQKSAHPFWVGN